MDDPFEITADRIVLDEARSLYVADGHVRVDQGDRRLQARWVAFSRETRIAVAEGDVQLDDGSDLLQAAFMIFDVDTLQGVLFHASLDAGSEGFLMRAKELVRTGQNTFTMRDGVFSTCRCEPGEKLPWEIHTSKANVELGGHGTVQNSTFNVLGVPVLWVPWAFFPVKSERETGFLLPSFGFGGRGGANFGLPFFWAALPQLNVTLTPRYFADRGFKQDVELEYVFGERSWGNLFVAGLNDDSSDDDNGTFPSERWAVIWEHDQDLPGELRWQSDVNVSSDNLYSDDFIELNQFATHRFIQSTTNVARDFGDSGGFGSMVAMRYADDIQGPNDADRDDVLLQRWTELRADAQPGVLRGPFGIEARVDSELIHFAGLRNPGDDLAGQQPGAGPPVRSDGRFYDLGINGQLDAIPSEGQGDGIFQPGEQLAERGTRVVIHPRIARAFEIGHLAEFVPEVGWQQTLYRTNATQFAERGLLTARAELRSRMARDYFGLSGKAIRHVVEPRLGWAYVSDRHQKSNPLFIPKGSVSQDRLRALSLENVTRNPSDRIDETNQLVLGLGQRFFSRAHAGQAPRLAADITTAIDWEFADDGGLGNIYVEGRLFPVGPISSHVRGTFNPETALFEEGEVGMNVSTLIPGPYVRAARLSTTYRYVANPPLFAEYVRGTESIEESGATQVSQVYWNAQVELTARVRLSYSAVLSLVSGEGFIGQHGLIEYVSKCRCWGLGVSLDHERRQGFSGGFEIRFMGLGDERSNLFDSGLRAGVSSSLVAQ
jgi:lipopolysaccharide assembly outer membrane protein LptD (OstA)